MAKHPKYINPATDFGFKKIFKDEEITRGFLNALMKKYNPEIHIAKVDITDGEEMETTLSFTNEIPLFMRLGKIASYSNLSTKQQIQYDDSYHNYMCYLGQMDYKLKQGIKIGKEEGRAEEKISMARIMKSSGEPVDKIVKYTGLTEEEINNL